MELTAPSNAIAIPRMTTKTRQGTEARSDPVPAVPNGLTKCLGVRGPNQIKNSPNATPAMRGARKATVR